jgi:hypothetical protein
MFVDVYVAIALCADNITCVNPNLQEQHAPSEWVQIVGGGFTKEDQFCIDVRRLQQRTGCTDATCDDIIRTFSNYLGAKIPSNFKAADKKIQLKAGAKCLRLNGCVGCDKHVFLPDDPAEECSLCGHQRYDAKGQPNETCFYFPLAPKLKALLRLPAYQKLIQYEFERQLKRRDPNLMSDVYDSPAWQEFMGAAVSPNNRIGT